MSAITPRQSIALVLIVELAVAPCEEQEDFMQCAGMPLVERAELATCALPAVRRYFTERPDMAPLALPNVVAFVSLMLEGKNDTYSIINEYVELVRELGCQHLNN